MVHCLKRFFFQFQFPDVILDVEKLEDMTRDVQSGTSRVEDVEAGRRQSSGPMIRIERASTAMSVEDTQQQPEAVEVKFDPKGKSVASGKNVTGWL